MKLTKIVFRGQVHGIVGDSVSSLGIEPSPTLRQVASLEMTPLGCVVTLLDGQRRLVPLHDCSTAELEPVETADASAPRGPKAKAR